MVAQTASVSYRRILTPETLLEILTTGDVPPLFLSHVLHVLDEASIQSVVMAVEQAAQESGIPIAVIWRNVAQISEKMQSHRNGAWTVLWVNESNCALFSRQTGDVSRSRRKFRRKSSPGWFPAVLLSDTVFRVCFGLSIRPFSACGVAAGKQLFYDMLLPANSGLPDQISSPENSQ